MALEAQKSEDLSDHSSNPLGADTRDRILDAASRLFSEQGFAATGVATIQQAARVRSGSLYHFFRSKDALLVAVLERYLERLGATTLEPVEATTADPIGRVFALLDLYRRQLATSGFRLGCPVGKLALEIGDEVPQARGLVDGYFAAWTERVRSWLEQAGARLPTDLDRAALARLVLATMEGGVMQAVAARDTAPYDAAVAQLRTHIEQLEAAARREREQPDQAPAPGPEARAGDTERDEHAQWRYW